MISKQSHTLEWLMEIRKSAAGRDPILIEKMVLALTLVENLQTSGLDFIFKGGTSLTLILGKPERFSIDIDIVLPRQQNLDLFFQQVISRGAFQRYEENLRKSGLPKQHFKFFFPSVVQKKESHILLDILFDENPYPRLQSVEIASPLICMDAPPVSVSCPTADCLLGDKLTAFAPTTSGVQYGAGKELEIAKQLFDIGALFDIASDADLIRQTFEETAKKELAYRGLFSLTPRDVLMDSFRAACLLGMRGAAPGAEYAELSDGIKKLAAFVYSGNFTIDTAAVCASKTAYLAALISCPGHPLQKFQSSAEISDWTIASPDYSKLNKLKKTSPEAFFYFYQALELQGR